MDGVYSDSDSADRMGVRAPRQGFLGWIAYLGAANAGVPISILVKQYGWGAFFTALMASSLIAFCLLVPILNQKSFKQKQLETATA